MCAQLRGRHNHTIGGHMSVRAVDGRLGRQTADPCARRRQLVHTTGHQFVELFSDSHPIGAHRLYGEESAVRSVRYGIP